MVRLGPGSPAPRNPQEVEALLQQVPRIAFFPELDAVLPAPLGDAPLDRRALASVDPTWLARVVDGLRALEQRAIDHDDGGLRFLAVTLRNFLRASDEAIEPAEHPLVVALFVRTFAQREGAPDHPNAVAKTLNRW